MDSKGPEQERGFKVEDRRRFTPTGEPRPQMTDNEPPPAGQKSPSQEPGFRMEAAPPAPEISFSTFVLSLSTQALAHLGEIPDPMTREVRVDLPAATQMIDILALLEQKTRGNLDAGEAELLRNILYDLRLHFVEKSKS